MRAHIKKKNVSFVGSHSEPLKEILKDIIFLLSLAPSMLSQSVSLDTMWVPWTVKKPVAFHPLYSNARISKSLTISVLLTSEYFIKAFKKGNVTKTLCSSNDVTFTI